MGSYLVPWPGIEPSPTAVKWRSLNYWIAREFQSPPSNNTILLHRRSLMSYSSWSWTRLKRLSMHAWFGPFTVQETLNSFSRVPWFEKLVVVFCFLPGGRGRGMVLGPQPWYQVPLVFRPDTYQAGVSASFLRLSSSSVSWNLFQIFHGKL